MYYEFKKMMFSFNAIFVHFKGSISLYGPDLGAFSQLVSHFIIYVCYFDTP